MRRSIAVAAVAIGAAVVAGAVAPAQATYRGANGRIAFGATGPDANTDIYSVAPDGSGLKRLTTDAAFDACPAFSPNGGKIAFCSNRSGGFQIWIMNADGSGERQLTKLTRAPYPPAEFPDFSPDGRRVAFNANDGGPAADDIYVVDIRGGKRHRFTGAPGNDEYAAFSPDGRTIAFVSHRKGIGQIWLMNASDGHNQRQLTRDQHGKDELPDWSPDSKRIAYGAGGDIWVMNADGSGQRNLTHDSAVEFGPAWSPDGTKIAYVYRGQQRRVYVMNSDGSGKHPLGGIGAQLVPAWQPLR